MTKRLLVIEDDPALGELMLDYCEEINLTPILVETGGEGVEKAKSEKPDAITVDNRLPDMFGLEVIEKLKSAPETAAIPVIFLSADAKMHEAEAKKRGAFGVLNKPVSPETLKETLEQCLGPW